MFDLRVGDCLVDWDANVEEVTEAGVVPCGEPHAYEDSELYFSYLYPTEDSWGEGDRILTCVLFLPDGDLVGSMRGAVR